MREIKFRAWDKEQKHWVNGLHFSLHLNGNVTDPAQSNLLMVDRYDVQQFTGLLDKNGVEIYEGDIVDVISISDGVKVGAVKYERGCFWVSCATGQSDLLFVPLRVTIIGNISENPELLGGEA